jgi:sensor histidine kinase YesM
MLILFSVCSFAVAHASELSSTTSNNSMAAEISLASPFWKEKWFKAMLVLAGLSGIYSVYTIRLRQIKHHELVKREFSQKLADMEMKVLKAQMNPHFIFNSLNAINWYILKSETDKASFYLTKFSKLIRLILDNSNQKAISLDQELTALKLYLEMEALRFNEKFSYAISVDSELNPLSIGVPPLVIQPFVENAIWQGLLHKEADGKIEIQVNRMPGGLKYVITDNGIGRKKSSELKSKAADEDKASGMKVNSDRLAILNRESNIRSVETIDLENAQGEPLGTQVIIKMLSAEIEPEF